MNNTFTTSECWLLSIFIVFFFFFFHSVSLWISLWRFHIVHIFARTTIYLCLTTSHRSTYICRHEQNLSIDRYRRAIEITWTWPRNCAINSVYVHECSWFRYAFFAHSFYRFDFTNHLCLEPTFHKNMKWNRKFLSLNWMCQSIHWVKPDGIDLQTVVRQATFFLSKSATPRAQKNISKIVDSPGQCQERTCALCSVLFCRLALSAVNFLLQRSTINSSVEQMFWNFDFATGKNSRHLYIGKFPCFVHLFTGFAFIFIHNHGNTCPLRTLIDVRLAKYKHSPTTHASV